MQPLMLLASPAGHVQLEAPLPSRQPELALGALSPHAQLSLVPRPLPPRRSSGEQRQLRSTCSPCPRDLNVSDLAHPRVALSSSGWPLRAEPGHAQAPMAPEEAESSAAPQRVAVFWDLDNKQPLSVAPREAVLRLRDVACQFGEPVDILAYANVNAFEYVPARVRAERRQQAAVEARQELGLEAPVEGLQCGLCGRRFAGTAQLRRHFVQLHQKEHRKRMAHLNALGPGKRRRVREKLRSSVERYQDAAAGVLQPKRGYGLMPELRRAGVHVRLVSRAPQAADEALKADMRRAMRSGMVGTILVISDDRGYSQSLEAAERMHGICTVVVGSAPSLQGSAYAWLSWDDISDGAPHVLDEAAAAAASWQRRCLGLSSAHRHEPVYWDSESFEEWEAESTGVPGQSRDWEDEAWEHEYLDAERAAASGEHGLVDSDGEGHKSEDWNSDFGGRVRVGRSMGLRPRGASGSGGQWESESDEDWDEAEEDGDVQWGVPGEDEDESAIASDHPSAPGDEETPHEIPPRSSKQDTTRHESTDEALGAWRSYEKQYKGG